MRNTKHEAPDHNCLPYPVTSSIYADRFLSTLFFYNTKPCSVINVRDQVSKPHKKHALRKKRLHADTHVMFQVLPSRVIIQIMLLQDHDAVWRKCDFPLQDMIDATLKC